MAMGAEGSMGMSSGGGEAVDWYDEGVGFEVDRASGASRTLQCVRLVIMSPSSASRDFFWDNCACSCRCLERRCSELAGLGWLGESSGSESEGEGEGERYMVSAWLIVRIEGEMVSCGRESDSGRGGDLGCGGEEGEDEEEKEELRRLMEQGGRCAGCGGMAMMSCSSIRAGSWLQRVKESRWLGGHGKGGCCR